MTTSDSGPTNDSSSKTSDEPYTTRFWSKIGAAFRREPRQVLSPILVLVESNLGFSISLGAFCSHRSLAALALVPLAGLISQLIAGLSMQARVIASWRRLARCATERPAEDTFRRHRASEYLGTDTVKLIGSKFVRNIAPYDVDDFLSVYSIDSPNTLVENCMAYTSPMFGGVILLPDAPEDANAASRFYLLHELGHGVDVFSSNPTEQFASTRAAAASCWALAHFGSAALAAPIGLCFATTFLFYGRLGVLRARASHLRSERFADLIAVLLCSQEVAKELSARRIDLLIAKDPTLTEAENRSRRTRCAAMLAQKAADADRDLFADHCDGLRNFPVLRPAVAITAAFALGCYAPPPTWSFVATAFVSCVATFGAAFLVDVMQERYRRSLLSYLDARRPVSSAS